MLSFELPNSTAKYDKLVKTSNNPKTLSFELANSTADLKPKMVVTRFKSNFHIDDASFFNTRYIGS